MTHVTRRLTAKNRDQLRNPTLGNRVWTTFTFFLMVQRTVKKQNGWIRFCLLISAAVLLRDLSMSCVLGLINNHSPRKTSSSSSSRVQCWLPQGTKYQHYTSHSRLCVHYATHIIARNTSLRVRLFHRKGLFTAQEV